MVGREHPPGEWLDLSEPGEYQRLLRLARRRLVGHEHHAEDVVSRAVVKWRSIPAHMLGVARIEQVIKSEAYSVLRSEQRWRARDTRFVGDPSLHPSWASGATDHELSILRRTLAETCKQHRISITDLDVEVLELLFAGLAISAVVRVTGMPRHRIRQSRDKWKRVLTKADIGPWTGAAGTAV